MVSNKLLCNFSSLCVSSSGLKNLKNKNELSLISTFVLFNKGGFFSLPSSSSFKFHSSFSCRFFSSSFLFHRQNFLSHGKFGHARRNLHLHEYQSKHLLNSFGLNIQKGDVASTAEEAKEIAKKLKEEGAEELIIKCQVLAGGRGKGRLSSGLKGGVQICKNEEEVYNYAKQMLNYKLYTHQTTQEGEMVKKVLIHEGVKIIKELYIAIVLDRTINSPTFIVSKMGGMDIEEVAKNNKNEVKCIQIDIVKGLNKNIINKVLDGLGMYEEGGAVVGGVGGGIGYSGMDNIREKTYKQIENLYKLFNQLDCTQLEINPLAITEKQNNKNQKIEKNVFCVDAKLQFDDNASFRHQDLFAMEDKTMMDPREAMAEKAGLNFVGMDGNIGCLVNGAGLAMATMDIIKLNGGNPANFLDLGGGADVDQVTEAFKILQTDKQVKGLFVNIFGGIMRCDIIAKGLVEAAKITSLNVPIVVRLCGSKADEGRRIMEQSGIKCYVIEDFESAAKKVCSFVRDA